MAKLKVDDLSRLQFDYAWKWFEFHARQRMIMFYYYLIITGIFGNALILAFHAEYYLVVALLCLLGLLTSAGFVVFDYRNRSMAAYGEAVLEKLESELLFPEAFTDEDGRRLGPMNVERREGMREGQPRLLRHELLKHKWWIRGIECAVGMLFGVALLVSLGLALYSGLSSILSSSLSYQMLWQDRSVGRETWQPHCNLWHESRVANNHRYCPLLSIEENAPQGVFNEESSEAIYSPNALRTSARAATLKSLVTSVDTAASLKWGSSSNFSATSRM